MSDVDSAALAAFGLPETGGVFDHRDGVRRALEGFQERQAAGKVKPVREKKPKSGRADLNEPCRKLLAAKGWKAERVDYYDHLTKRSHDLLGMFDYLAFGEGSTIGVQLTSKANMAARVSKMQGDKRLQWVQGAGWKVLVLGFYKDPRGHWAAEERWIG